MNPQWDPPPAADPCLSRPYSSRPNQKGGTFVDETVLDLATHRRNLLNPDEYRLDGCRCGKVGGMHVHGRRERHPRQFVFEGEPVPVVEILVFLCTACGATWRVLPAFLARCLWRTWDVVERAVLDQPRGPDGPALPAPPVPVRTVQRWRSRLAQAAHLPLQVFVAYGGRLRELVERLGLDASRAQLVAAHARGIGALAVLLHRLAPGVRLV